MTTAPLFACPDCNLQFKAKPHIGLLGHSHPVQCPHCDCLLQGIYKQLEANTPQLTPAPSLEKLIDNNLAYHQATLPQVNSSKRDSRPSFNISSLDQIDYSQDFQSLQEQHLHQTKNQHILQAPELYWDDMPFFNGENKATTNNATNTSSHLPSPPIRPNISSDFHFDTPLNLNQPVSTKRQTRLWYAGSLLATILLLLQWSYANLASLAEHSALRPALGYFCLITNCELPPLVDLQKVIIHSLSVRPHPTEPATLELNAVIENQATFKQPFPSLSLRFKNSQGHTLLTLSFKPKDYLSGELSGAINMPTATPIHIALNVVDLGAEATQYQMSFY